MRVGYSSGLRGPRVGCKARAEFTGHLHPLKTLCHLCGEPHPSRLQGGHMQLHTEMAQPLPTPCPSITRMGPQRADRGL